MALMSDYASQTNRKLSDVLKNRFRIMNLVLSVVSIFKVSAHIPCSYYKHVGTVDVGTRMMVRVFLAVSL